MNEPELLPIFVYGTLQRGEARAALWPCSPQRVIPARTRGTLFDLGPYPALVPGAGWVAGELWYVAQQDLPATLAALDDIECYGKHDVDLYDRRIIACWTADEAECRAFAYFFARTELLANHAPMAPGLDGVCRWRRQ